MPSDRKWNRSQSCQGTTELVFPGPALGQVQSEAARRAGEPSGDREEPPPEGLGGHHLLVQTDARRPESQVMCHHLDGQPGSVGGEAARGEMVETDAVLEVANGVLDLGVAAMVGLQFQGIPVPVGDEAVIAVGGEEGQLGTGRGFHPPDDEPHRHGVGLILEGGVAGLRHIGGTAHPVEVLTTIRGSVEKVQRRTAAEIRATNIVFLFGRLLAISTSRDFVVSTFGSGGPTNLPSNPGDDFFNRPKKCR